VCRQLALDLKLRKGRDLALRRVAPAGRRIGEVYGYALFARLAQRRLEGLQEQPDLEVRDDERCRVVSRGWWELAEAA
jgi:hypothetical protein